MTNYTTEQLRPAWEQMAKIGWAAGLLATKPENGNAWQDEAVQALFGRWIADGGDPITSYGSIDEFLQKFEDWANEFVVKPIRNDGSVRVSITRHYGRVSIEFALEQTFAISSDADIARAMAYLDKRVQFMAREWEIQNVPAMGQQQAQAPQAQQPNNNRGGGGNGSNVTITGTLEHTIDGNGRHRFRLKGGMYTKFGVSVYNEELAKVGISEASPIGQLGQFAGEVEFVGMQPKRIVNLRRAT